MYIPIIAQMDSTSYLWHLLNVRKIIHMKLTLLELFIVRSSWNFNQKLFSLISFFLNNDVMVSNCKLGDSHSWLIRDFKELFWLSDVIHCLCFYFITFHFDLILFDILWPESIQVSKACTQNLVRIKKLKREIKTLVSTW